MFLIQNKYQEICPVYKFFTEIYEILVYLKNLILRNSLQIHTQLQVMCHSMKPQTCNNVSWFPTYIHFLYWNDFVINFYVDIPAVLFRRFLVCWIRIRPQNFSITSGFQDILTYKCKKHGFLLYSELNYVAKSFFLKTRYGIWKYHFTVQNPFWIFQISFFFLYIHGGNGGEVITTTRWFRNIGSIT